MLTEPYVKKTRFSYLRQMCFYANLCCELVAERNEQHLKILFYPNWCILRSTTCVMVEIPSVTHIKQQIARSPHPNPGCCPIRQRRETTRLLPETFTAAPHFLTREEFLLHLLHNSSLDWWKNGWLTPFVIWCDPLSDLSCWVVSHFGYSSYTWLSADQCNRLQCSPRRRRSYLQKYGKNWLLWLRILAQRPFLGRSIMLCRFFKNSE